MSIENQEYSVDQDIISFFQKTSTDRSSCDDRARTLVGGTVTPVAVQGACSYSVYAGLEYVVQFRLRSLGLKTEITNIARNVYGTLVPSVSYHGQIGRDDVSGKESLSVYVMSRVEGISHLDFILAHNLPENSPEYFTWRENLVFEIARFFALTWKNPQNVDRSFCENLDQRYDKDLRRLLAALPDRFHPIIQQSIDALPAIFSLPMVLLHMDFEIGPFGTNLHSLQQFMSKYRLGVGWIRYGNYDTLNNFWNILSADTRGLEKETFRTIKSAMIVGLLLSHGFTSRLANMPKPEPIRDDKSGAYKMLGLDGLLIVPATSIVN
ncbi:hypothetical protein DTO012A7_4829 [Penicillium roqueforti]|nr:hypothetical protein CBS147326_4267 [Penicillium roqueforti]KAI3233842.1 hypothetical protein DTO012A7_4829 [Penicillium roqueforti]KAI3283261.1 hypothetical protein CBS147309_1311 [Penicillium roqueforti]KAI3300105.1 hypothetical protein DTO002I6_828 [Penicillium roqueforti]